MKKFLLFSAAVLTLGISVAGTTSVASAATNSDSKEEIAQLKALLAKKQ